MDLKTMNSDDNRTVVNYSVMFYYTPQVAANIDDLDGFFDRLISETNQGKSLTYVSGVMNQSSFLSFLICKSIINIITISGYRQSGIPVRLSKFCTELATMNDMPDAKYPVHVLLAFKRMKGF